MHFTDNTSARAIPSHAVIMDFILHNLFKHGNHVNLSICFNFSQITLDSPEEYLVQVQGTMKSVLQENVITSLTIITNKKSYGPYGCESGRKFETPPEGLVVGFFGRASVTSLNQIGCIVKMPNTESLETVDSRYFVSPDAVIIPQGPWGNSGGQEFYDGRGDVVDLSIKYNPSHITWIQVGYEQGGTSFHGAPHGGEGAQHVLVCHEPIL